MCDGNKAQPGGPADAVNDARVGMGRAQTVQDSTLKASAYEDHKAEALRRHQAEIRAVSLEKAIGSSAMGYTENLSAEAIVARAATFAKFLENGAS